MPAQVADDSVESGYTACQFHPDGLILGTGTQGSMVHIWEVRAQKVITDILFLPDVCP